MPRAVGNVGSIIKDGASTFYAGLMRKGVPADGVVDA